MATTKYLTADLKHEIDEHGKRIGTLETKVEKNESKIERNISDLNKVCGVLDKVDDKIDTVEKAIIKISTTLDSNSAFNKWALGIVTSILIAVITAVVTGNLVLVAP